jgi:hypothetical protein
MRTEDGLGRSNVHELPTLKESLRGLNITLFVPEFLLLFPSKHERFARQLASVLRHRLTIDAVEPSGCMWRRM